MVWYKLEGGVVSPRAVAVECDRGSTSINKLCKLVHAENALILPNTVPIQLIVKTARGEVIDRLNMKLSEVVVGESEDNPFIVQVPARVVRHSVAAVAPPVSSDTLVFTTPPSSLKNLFEPSDVLCKHLVGLDRVMDESMAHIERFLHLKTTSHERKPMLLYSRMSRGGKTVALCSLFDKIKKRQPDWCPMIISFNGSNDFKRFPDETDEEALFRVIACQFADRTVAQLKRKVTVDWEGLNTHIGDVPFVLLIDEINRLCDPISATVANLLKQYFLNPRNRYLVVTSHHPVDVVEENDPSQRPCEAVTLPFSTNVAKLKGMGKQCGLRITEALAAYYGGVPALMFSSLEGVDTTPEERFKSYRRSWRSWTDKKRNKAVDEFIDEMFTGEQSGVSARPFDIFGTFGPISVSEGVGTDQPKRIVWPPCYIRCILRMSSSSPAIKAVEPYFKQLEQADVVLRGQWWENLITVALLLRCYQASITLTDSIPFNICTSDQARGAAVELVKIPEHIKKPDEEAKKFILGNARDESRPRLTLFLPKNQSFEQFDGFLSFCPKKGRAIVTGYQCKYGSQGSEGHKPNWLHSAVHLRGEAPAATSGASQQRAWDYYTRDQVMELLGVSLGILYPATLGGDIGASEEASEASTSKQSRKREADNPRRSEEASKRSKAATEQSTHGQPLVLRGSSSTDRGPSSR